MPAPLACPSGPFATQAVPPPPASWRGAALESTRDQDFDETLRLGGTILRQRSPYRRGEPRAVCSALRAPPREQLAATARALDAALQVRWEQRGLYVSVADGWSRFFAETCPEASGAASKLSASVVERAICGGLLCVGSDGRSASSWVTREDVHALVDYVDPAGSGAVTPQQWQLRLFRLELEQQSSSSIVQSDDSAAKGDSQKGDTQNSTGADDEAALAATTVDVAAAQEDSVTLPQSMCADELICSTMLDSVDDTALDRDMLRNAEKIAVFDHGDGDSDGCEQDLERELLEFDAAERGQEEGPMQEQHQEDQALYDNNLEVGAIATHSVVSAAPTTPSKGGSENESLSASQPKLRLTSTSTDSHRSAVASASCVRHSLAGQTLLSNEFGNIEDGGSEGQKLSTSQPKVRTSNSVVDDLNVGAITPSDRHGLSGHTLRPQELGNRVAVVGDGWGSGDGGFEAIVTEADDLTFTVISVADWKETHVLRSSCIAIRSSAAAPASPRNATKRGCVAAATPRTVGGRSARKALSENRASKKRRGNPLDATAAEAGGA